MAHAHVLEELEEKTQETVGKTDPIAQVQKKLDISQMLPTAKAENKPVNKDEFKPKPPPVPVEACCISTAPIVRRR